jgi:hypothetical protein
MKTSVFWDITPCNPLKVGRRFGGTCRLHHQGRRISQARNQHEAGSKQSLYKGNLLKKIFWSLSACVWHLKYVHPAEASSAFSGTCTPGLYLERLPLESTCLVSWYCTLKTGTVYSSKMLAPSYQTTPWKLQIQCRTEDIIRWQTLQTTVMKLQVP